MANYLQTSKIILLACQASSCPWAFVHTVSPKWKMLPPSAYLANSYSSFRHPLTQVSSSLGNFLLTSKAYQLARFGVSSRLYEITPVGGNSSGCGVLPIPQAR